MAIKVLVNQETCIGCGACTAVAPSIFEMNDDGLAFNILDENSEIPEELEEEANEAVESCPVIAITTE